jgi:hypothetical protein
MILDDALRLTGALMALAFIQQSLEHLDPGARRQERWLFIPRLILSAALFLALVFAPDNWFLPQVLTLALVINHLLILPFFNGPYNGGADRMSLLVLIMVTLAYHLPTGIIRKWPLAIWGCNWCCPISSPVGSRW